MPTYIDTDIPVGSVQSGELVLKNVVIETALPYKPPVAGGIRSAPYSDYISDGTERMILFDGNKSLMTIDAEDGKHLLAEGWKLIGMFDRATAEQVAEKIASNPPPDNQVMMAKKNQKRLFGMGVLATMLPVAKMNLLAQREIKLEQKVGMGMIRPPEPAKDAAMAVAVSADAAKVQTVAANIAQQISNTLGPLAASGYMTVYVLGPWEGQAGGPLDSWLSRIRDSSGRELHPSMVPKDLYEQVYYHSNLRNDAQTQSAYNTLDRQRAMGMKIYRIFRVKTGPDNPYVNSIFNIVNEWNATKQKDLNGRAVTLVTSTFGDDRNLSALPPDTMVITTNAPMESYYR